MRKSMISILLIAATVMTLFAGCGSNSGPTLPTLDLYSSSLTGTVEYVDGQSCRVSITEGDDHYDEETSIQLTYSKAEGKALAEVGDKVSFDYNYIEDVADYNGLPHITVEQIKVG